MTSLPFHQARGDLATSPLDVNGPLEWFLVLESLEAGCYWRCDNGSQAFPLRGGMVYTLPGIAGSVQLHGDGTSEPQPVTVLLGCGRAPSSLGDVRVSGRHSFLGTRSNVLPIAVSATEPSIVGAPYPAWTSPLLVAGVPRQGPPVDIPRAIVAVAGASQANRAFTLYALETFGVGGSNDDVPVAGGTSASLALRGGRHVASLKVDCLSSSIQLAAGNPSTTLTVTVEIAAWAVW